MKIAWFTPFSKKSAIGKCSQNFVNALSDFCEIDLWLSESKNLLNTSANTIFYSSVKDSIFKKKIKNYDFCIYNMGNYLPFHRDIYEVSSVYKGIVILHDYFMHDFFRSYYLDYLKNKKFYEKELERFYGIKLKNDAHLFSKQLKSIPFFERAILGHYGVIVHSKFLKNLIREKFPGPVAKINFPFYNEKFSNFLKEIRIDHSVSGNKLIMTTVGMVNPNKKIDSVLRVIGRNKQISERVLYQIIGNCTDHSYFEYLKKLVKKYNLSHVVKFLGFQPEDKLRNYLSQSDILINLRYPAYEGASWSLIEGMAYGKPVIVINNGFYSEIPNSYLLKIEAESIDKQLCSNLLNLISDKDLRRDYGNNAQKYIINNFADRKSAKDIIDFCRLIKKMIPLINLIDEVGDEFALMEAKYEQAIDYVVEDIFNLS